jgi:hypothetical protein
VNEGKGDFYGTPIPYRSTVIIRAHGNMSHEGRFIIGPRDGGPIPDASNDSWPVIEDRQRAFVTNEYGLGLGKAIRAGTTCESTWNRERREHCKKCSSDSSVI